MKKTELLKIIDQKLLDSLFGFCYARTSCSTEAEVLCSDIIFALIKVAKSEGEIEDLYAFIWRVARNTYADYIEKKKKESLKIYEGNPEEVLLIIPVEENEDTEEEDSYQLRRIYRQISFLTKAYREVMISYYLDGLSMKDIASIQGTSENTIRQRLFSARNTIKQEIAKQERKEGIDMEGMEQKPVGLQKMDYVIMGTGDPSKGDPRNVCQRQISKHIVWLCRNKKRTAKEISEELNLPMLYVEEELEIQTWGENGTYGMLKKLPDGKYINNVLLFDKSEVEALRKVYTEKIPTICNKIIAYVKKHEADYLAFPYINKKVDFNMILWQQISAIRASFENLVEQCLEETYFSNITKKYRPFSLYGFRYYDDIQPCCNGWDGIKSGNICGYTTIKIENISIYERLYPHFYCNTSAILEPKMQLAIQAIQGLDIRELSEELKEQAAKAIECGYLFCENHMLYTKFLVLEGKDRDRLFDISNGLKEVLLEDAKQIAKELAVLIPKIVPEHLMSEYTFANGIAEMPLLNVLVDEMIEKGMLVLPENGIGAEGCWMSVEK